MKFLEKNTPLKLCYFNLFFTKAIPMLWQETFLYILIAFFITLSKSYNICSLRIIHHFEFNLIFPTSSFK